MNLQNFKDVCDLIVSTDEPSAVKLKKLSTVFRKFINYLETSFDGTIPAVAQSSLESMARFYRKKAMDGNKPLRWTKADQERVKAEIMKHVYNRIHPLNQENQWLKERIAVLEEKAQYAPRQSADESWNGVLPTPPGLYY